MVGQHCCGENNALFDCVCNGIGCVWVKACP
jgi:hypothetical protein